VDVHQHHVVAGGAEHGQSDGAGAGRVGTVAQPIEHQERHVAGGGIVLDHQDLDGHLPHRPTVVGVTDTVTVTAV